MVPKASSVSSSSTASESSAILQYVHRLRVSLSVVSSYALRVELTVKVALVLTNTAPTASHSMALWCCIPADKVIVWVNQKHMQWKGLFLRSPQVYSFGNRRFIPPVIGDLFFWSPEVYIFGHWSSKMYLYTYNYIECGHCIWQNAWNAQGRGFFISVQCRMTVFSLDRAEYKLCNSFQVKVKRWNISNLPSTKQPDCCWHSACWAQWKSPPSHTQVVQELLSNT